MTQSAWRYDISAEVHLLMGDSVYRHFYHPSRGNKIGEAAMVGLVMMYNSKS